MALTVSSGAPVLVIRRAAYEASGLTRDAIDKRFGLTPDEFRVEGSLVAIGPIYTSESTSELIAALEVAGLIYYDDFFELSGNWPEWLRLHASSV